jgi:tripartite-type tricarboxylate transporter receptor subunit TctC
VASAKTPPELVKRWNEELNKVLRNPEVASKLSAQGIDLAGGSPEKARVFIDQQIETWTKVVKDNNIKPD